MQPGKTVFFEMEDWGIELLKTRGLADQVDIYREPLHVKSAVLSPDAEAVSVFIYSEVTRDVIDALPNLRLVTTRSTGYDHIDIEACNERGILVCNVPRYGENTVAEHAFGLILALSRKIYHAVLRTSRMDFSTDGLRGFDLKDKTLGVIGAGAIGMHVIRIGKGFGMNVLAYDSNQQSLLAEVLGYKYVSLEELLANSDVISIHVPLSPATQHLINHETIKLIKRGAILINTARGSVVQTSALVQALNEGIIVGAGLDVLEGEETIKEEAQLLGESVPVEKLRTVIQNYALLHRDNVIITPHIGFYSIEAEERIMDTTVENIRAFRAGMPQNVVNKIAVATDI
ncbi:MAG TPA: hydroxyacid dehydrogenase [Armatimonadota bacterium]|nr:hydroxyacid dehydrogenase [Armatimonadota bacterium]HPP74680.1 hydroxyacid dehydrogenase [Armatimonadota bacterium]